MLLVCLASSTVKVNPLTKLPYQYYYCTSQINVLDKVCGFKRESMSNTVIHYSDTLLQLLAYKRCLKNKLDLDAKKDQQNTRPS